MKSESKLSVKKLSHMELSGDWTSTSPSNSNLTAGKFRLVGVRLFCSNSKDWVVFLDSVTDDDSLGEVGCNLLHEFSLLRDPMLPQRALIIFSLYTLLNSSLKQKTIVRFLVFLQCCSLT
jgi:hypothetical protein